MIKIHKFMFLARKMLDKELLRECGISFSQFRILTVVHNEPGISQRKIADLEELTEAAVSRHVTGLSVKGYIVFIPNTKNKKQHILELAEPGEKMCKKAFKLVEEKAETLLSALSVSQQKTISDSFDTLIDKVRSDSKIVVSCPITTLSSR